MADFGFAYLVTVYRALIKQSIHHFFLKGIIIVRFIGSVSMDLNFLKDAGIEYDNAVQDAD